MILRGREGKMQCIHGLKEENGARTPLGDCEPFRMASQGHVQTLTLAHTRKVQGVMQMCQTRQMQIDEDACIRN